MLKWLKIIQFKRSAPSGSIVYCDLAYALEHTGIYINDKKIIHLDGNGSICQMSTRIAG